MKINNKEYKLFFRKDLKDDRNRPIEIEYDINACEITLNSNLPLNRLHSVCDRVVLAIMLDTTKVLKDLTEHQKDIIIDLFSDEFDELKTDSERLVATFCGLMCRGL